MLQPRLNIHCWCRFSRQIQHSSIWEVPHCGWAKSCTAFRNPGMNPFPCKCKQMVSFRGVRIHPQYSMCYGRNSLLWPLPSLSGVLNQSLGFFFGMESKHGPATVRLVKPEKAYQLCKPMMVRSSSNFKPQQNRSQWVFFGT